MIDRLPPHSIEAEQGVLGCVMLSPNDCLNTCLEKFERGSEAFYDLRHQTIFDTLVEMRDGNKAIDLITLQENLKLRDQLEAVGGIPYLSALPDAVPSAANLEYYIEIVSEKAVLRRMLQTCTSIVSRIYNDPENVEAIVAQAEAEVLAVRCQRKEKTPSTKELVREAISEIERLHRQQGKTGGLSTGFIDLDKLTDGLHGGEMVVVAGYPGAGKSAIAMNIAEHAAIEQEQPVGVFSLEMSAKRLVMRMLASRGRVNMRNIRDGYLAERDFPKLAGAGSKIGASRLHFCDLSDLTISQLRAKARQMVQQHGIKMFVIDYLQLLTAPGKRDQNREQEVASISRGIKLMASEFDVPVIALSQLNDDGKLRESRAIGQDADCIWALKAREDQDQHGEATAVDLEIRKQRDGQAPATVNLTFFKQFVRFESAAKEMPTYDKD